MTNYLLYKNINTLIIRFDLSVVLLYTACYNANYLFYEFFINENFADS